MTVKKKVDKMLSHFVTPPIVIVKGLFFDWFLEYREDGTTNDSAN